MATIVQKSGTVTRIVGTPLGKQQITGLSSAQTLTVPAGAASALIQPLTQNVRMRCLSTDPAPTASSGIRLTVGLIMNYDADLAELRFIEEAASAVLEVEYFG